ncbi:uncharacterized protein LOC143775184 [Ranitomeya variabilis]|uniref:uncharacterized protein LOC143775184 n=1 Tax=Ranitomeya variabilis TaxID=490064 RepID=UPI004056C547
MVVLGETFYEQQTKDTLVALCKSQHIDYANKNKSQLVAVLMQWEAALDHSQSPEAADASTSEHGAAAEVQPLNAGPVSNPGELDPHLQAALKEFPTDDHEGRRQLIQQYRQEAEARAEREAQRAEREAQAQREYQLQMARLQMQGSSQSSREPSSAQTPKPRPDHFPVMEKDGDLDTFLRAFEKACRQYQLPTQEWARYLTPGLRGKALEAFAALPQEQDGDYEAIKQALIAKYQLTPEVYRKKFRTLLRGPHDSYSDVVHRLGTHFDQWTQGLSVTTFTQLRDLMIKDQFFRLCPTEVRQFVMDREPNDVTKAAQIADAYEANRRSEVRKPVTTSWRGGKPAANASTPASQHTRGPVPVANSTRPTTELRQCYHCRQTGHLSHQCPARQKNPSSQAPGPNAAVLLVGGVVGRVCDNVQPVTVGGRVATGLKDTGAERTLIRPELAAPEEIIPGKTLTRSPESDCVQSLV